MSRWTLMDQKSVYSVCLLACFFAKDDTTLRIRLAKKLAIQISDKTETSRGKNHTHLID